MNKIIEGLQDARDGNVRIIRPDIPETCGTCHFGHDFREGPLMPLVTGAIECRGVPPTPVIMGQGPNGAAVGLMRARIAKTETACALYRKKAPPIEPAK